MTTRLESLKVSAELDASKYAEGARQKIAADQAMVDSAKSVDGSVQVTQQRLGISSSAVDRLARSLDPAAKSSANLAYVQGTLSRAMDQGRITQERSDQLWALAKERYGAAGAAAEAAGGKISDMREILRLAADTANGNMAGMARSGALLANAFGLLGLVMNPVVIGGAAIGAAFVAAGIHAANLQGEQNRLNVALTATGKDAVISAAQLEPMIKNMERLGVSHAEALAAVTGAARVPGSSISDIRNATDKLALDFAAAFGGNVADATVKLAEMSAQGYAGIKKLDDAYNFLTPDQALHIRQLAEEGDKAGALAIANEALASRTKDAFTKSNSEIGKSVADLKAAFEDLWDTIAEGAVGQITLTVLTEGAKAIAHPTSSPLGAALNPVGFLAGVIPDIYSAATGYFSGPGTTGTWNAGASGDWNAPGFPSPLAKPAGPPDQGLKAVQDEAAAYRELSGAMQAAAGVRSIAIARVQAEQEALAKGYSAKATDELIVLRQSQARDKLKQSAGDSMAAMKAETEGLIATAAAYDVSIAAGKEAEAQAQAHSEKLKNAAVDEKATAAAIRDHAAAQGLANAAQKAGDMKFQADMAERALAAAPVSIEASAEAARQADVETFARLLTVTDKTRDAIEREIVAYDEDSLRRSKAVTETEHLTRARDALNEAFAGAESQIEQNRIESETFGLTSGQIARLNFERKIQNDLIKEHVAITPEQTARERADGAAIEASTDALQRMKATQGEVEGFFTQSFDRIGTSITDAFTKGQAAMVSLKSVASGLLSELLQEVVKLSFLNPAKNALFGGDHRPELADVGGWIGDMLGFGGSKASGAVGAATTATAAATLNTAGVSLNTAGVALDTAAAALQSAAVSLASASSINVSGGSGAGDFIGGLFGNFFGGATSGSIDATSMLDSSLGMMPWMFHEGGISGDEGRQRRFVPRAMFAHAPRAHSGIGPGEMPVIVNRDEGIFTPGQMRAMGRGGRSGTVVYAPNTVNSLDDDSFK